MRDATQRGDTAKRGMFGAVERIIKYPYGNRFGVGKGTRFGGISDGSSNSVAISEVLSNGKVDGRTSSSAPAGMNRDVRGALLCPMMGGNSFSGFFPPNSSGTDVTNGCPLSTDPAAFPSGHPDVLHSGSKHKSYHGGTVASSRSKRSHGRCQHRLW